jgi:tripartite-type tricarboxylate transporter receptor subunit TctC
MSFSTASKFSRRRFIKNAGTVAAGIAAPSILTIRSALAAFPDRPIKIVVANTPGGPSDLVGRMLTGAIQQATSKTMVIENIGGGGGNIGMANVARSDPDGYTILLATNVFSVNPALYNKVPYDPLKDFVGVCELATSPSTWAIKSELPSKTLKEFIAYARANPDKVNVSSPPVGTASFIATELLKLRENLPTLQNVVFKGGGDALQALLSGTVQMCSGALPPAATHIQAGTLRCLAVTGENRWPGLPDVPTMAEAGYKDFVLAVDTVFLAPAKTPPEAIKWLETETLKVLNEKSMKDKLFAAGFEVRPKGAAAAWDRVTKEIDMFRTIIDQAGITKL